MDILCGNRKYLMDVIKCSGNLVSIVNIIKRIIVDLIMLIDMYILSFFIYDILTQS